MGSGETTGKGALNCTDSELFTYLRDVDTLINTVLRCSSAGIKLFSATSNIVSAQILTTAIKREGYAVYCVAIVTTCWDVPGTLLKF